MATQPPTSLILRNSSMALTATGEGLGVVTNAAIVIESGRIVWIGAESDLPSAASQATEVHDLGGRFVSPGLVDCHAHPIFAGRRADEFARRARGDHYLDIAREGGGIMATVRATRDASTEELVELSCRRMQHALQAGTTSMEAKSGYDLTVDGELRLLQVVAEVGKRQPITLHPTLLGAHALPPEFADDRAGFIASVTEEMIPRAAALKVAEAVDVYCDEGAFTLEETRTILETAKRHGLRTKAHIGQFVDLGAAQMLAELGSLSGDHLEAVSREGLAAMGKARVVATMLPGACVQLRMSPPPVEEIRRAGVAMAIGSDLNPGTSHSESLPLAMWLATTHYGMTVEEAWLGVTRHAAQALGAPSSGQIAVGGPADLVVWNAELPSEIPYHFGVNLAARVYKDGRTVVGAARL